MKEKYPDTYSEGEVAILQRIAVLETKVEIHSPCKGLMNLQRAFWGALVFLVVTLVPLALSAIAGGIK